MNSQNFASILPSRPEPDPSEIHHQIQLIVRAVAFRIDCPEKAILCRSDRLRNDPASYLVLWLIDSLVECSYPYLANYFHLPIGEIRRLTQCAVTSIATHISDCTDLGQTAIAMQAELGYKLDQSFWSHTSIFVPLIL